MILRVIGLIAMTALAGCPMGTQAPKDHPSADQPADQPSDQAAAQGGDTKGDATAGGDTTAAQEAAQPPDKAANAEAKPPKLDPQAEIIGECMLTNSRITKTPSGGYACIRKPKDAGKHCTNGTECPYSVCLADSQTCSPIWPLYGCYDILSGVGNRMKYCRE